MSSLVHSQIRVMFHPTSSSYLLYCHVLSVPIRIESEGMAPKAKAPVPIPKKSRPPPKGIPRPTSTGTGKKAVEPDSEESSGSDRDQESTPPTVAQFRPMSSKTAGISAVTTASQQAPSIQGLFVGATPKQLLTLSKEIFSYLSKTSSHYCVLLSKSRLRNVLQRVSQNWMLLRRYRWAPDHLMKKPKPILHPSGKVVAADSPSPIEVQSLPGPSTLGEIQKSVHAIKDAMELYDAVLKDCYEHVMEGSELRLDLEALLQSALAMGSDRFDPSGNPLWSVLNSHLLALQEDLAVKELVKRHIRLAVGRYTSTPNVAGQSTSEPSDSFHLLCLDDSIQSTLDGDLLRNYTHAIITGANYTPFIPRDLERVNEVIVMLSSHQ